jgi:hypothetical protein
MLSGPESHLIPGLIGSGGTEQVSARPLRSQVSPTLLGTCIGIRLPLLMSGSKHTDLTVQRSRSRPRALATPGRAWPLHLAQNAAAFR